MRVFVVVLFALIALSSSAHQCTEKQEVKCVDDVRAGEPACEAAFKSGFSDITKVLKCLTYVQKAQADCLDCICYILETFGQQVKVCQQTSNLVYQ